MKCRKCKFKPGDKRRSTEAFCNVMLSYAYNQSESCCGRRRRRFFSVLKLFASSFYSCVQFGWFVCFVCVSRRCQCTLFFVVNVVCFFCCHGFSCAIAYGVWPPLRSLVVTSTVACSNSNSSNCVMRGYFLFYLYCFRHRFSAYKIIIYDVCTGF